MYHQVLRLTQYKRMVALLMCFLFSACAAPVKPDVPKIETYLRGDLRGVSPEPASTMESTPDRSDEPVAFRVGEHPLDLDTCVRIALDNNPINRAAIVFMISFVPAKIRVTRMSRHARAIGYSSQ